MKSIHKSLPILLLALSVVGCSGDNNKEGNFKLTKKSAINELNEFFNSDYGEFSIDLVTQGTNTNICGIYNDDEKMILTYPQNHGVNMKEINTSDMTYLQGDGINVGTNQDNSSLFVPTTYFDYKKVIKNPELVEDQRRLTFKLNLKDATSNVLDNDMVMEQLNELFGQVGVSFDLSKVPFEAYYNDKGLCDLTMVFDDFFSNTLLAGIKMRLKYKISSYGKNYKKKDFDLTNFVSVDSSSYNLAKSAITDKYQGGDGLTFYAFSVDEPFRNEIPKDLQVGTIVISAAYYQKPIYFRDVTFNEKLSRYEFYYLGKLFSFEMSEEIARYRARESTLNYALDYQIEEYDNNPNPALMTDYENNRILMNCNNVVKVFDINTLSVVKQFEVEGTINRIMCHDDAYHITTCTVMASSAIYDDYECYGNIYVIDKNTLEIIENYANLNCNPYYTVVDNRGDIAISPACGQGSSMSLYHPNTGMLERLNSVYLDGYHRDLYKRCYLDYNKDTDTIIANETCISGAVRPNFFDYKNGKYVARDHAVGASDNNYTDYGEILLSYKNFIASKREIVNVEKWESPIATKNFLGSYNKYNDRKVVFAHGDYVYWLQGNHSTGNTLLTVFNIKTGEIEDTHYLFDESYLYISFGFVRNDKFYLFDSALQQFNIYSVDLK